MNPTGRRLVLLRHGETTIGGGVLLGSRLDPGLSAHGECRAVAAGARLSHLRIVRLVCSPQRRALETAAAALPGCEIQIDERLRELDMGVLTGLTWVEAKERHRASALAWRAGEAPSGGEDAKQLRARVIGAVLDALAAVHAGDDGDIVLVTHSTPIRALIGTVRELEPAEWRRVRIGHGGIRVVRMTPRALQQGRSGPAEPAARGVHGAEGEEPIAGGGRSAASPPIQSDR